MVQPADVTAPQPEDLQRGSRLGPYELLLRIGRGGMATVWVARTGLRPEDQRLVAIKAILQDLATDDEFRGMFLDEGRIIKMIRHPNVVDVYEAGDHAGIMYIAMEWVEGDSLHAIIAEAGRRRPIPPEMAVRIIADAAAGLHAAHELKDASGQPMNLVHRDVSPHNILIGIDGSVKLVDFGVAKAIGRLSEATSAGQLKGKFGYMSPEQAMAKKVDRRSDVFALGIVLFELTTGRRLFRGEHDAETLHMVVSGKIPRPSALEASYPKPLEEIVMRALTRDPNKRFQTAEELQHALEAYLKSERVVVPRAGIANLLKKVLGPRIEQRRKAIRGAVRAIEAPSAPLASAPDAAQFAPVSGEHSTGVSSVTPGTGSSPGSGVSAVSGVAPVTHAGARISAVPPLPGEGTHPSAVSQVGAFAPPPYPYAVEGTATGGTVIVKRGGTTGIVIGVIGLLVAAGAVLFLLYGPHRKTTIVNVQAATPTAQPATTTTETKKTESKPDPKDDIPAVPIDSLGSAAAPPKKPPPIGFRPQVATQKPVLPTPQPQPQPTTTTAPPRKNPYE